MKSSAAAALFAFLLTASAIAQQAEPPAKPEIPNCGKIELNPATNRWNCFACVTGFVATGVDRDVCSACAMGCLDGCVGTTTSCNKCKEGYFSTSSTFPAPCSSCTARCRTCASSLTCSACFEGNYKTSNLGTDSCNMCISGCRVCSGPTGCDLCYSLHSKVTENGIVKCNLDGSAILWIVMIIITSIICLICICWLSCMFCFAKAVSSTAPPQHNSSFTH